MCCRARCVVCRRACLPLGDTCVRCGCPGARVPACAQYVDCFSAGPRTSGEYQQYGGCASFAVAPAEAVRPIPERFTYDQACNFSGNYETAYYVLLTRGMLKVCGPRPCTRLARLDTAGSRSRSRCTWHPCLRVGGIIIGRKKTRSSSTGRRERPGSQQCTSPRCATVACCAHVLRWRAWPMGRAGAFRV